MDSGDKTALIKDDVEVVLSRLERAREAIQEIRPILLNHLQKEQPEYAGIGETYVNYLNSLKGAKAADGLAEERTETDPKLIISETIALLGEISSLVQAKRDEIMLTSRTEEDVRTRAMESCRAGKVETENSMSPERNFYFLLANSDLGTLRKSSRPIAKR